VHHPPTRLIKDISEKGRMMSWGPSPCTCCHCFIISIFLVHIIYPSPAARDQSPPNLVIYIEQFYWELGLAGILTTAGKRTAWRLEPAPDRGL